MRKLLTVFAVLTLLGTTAAVGVLWKLDRDLTVYATTATGAGVPTVLIPPGTGPRALAELLAREGVVQEPSYLYWYIRREKLSPKLKAGEYEFALPASPSEILAQIARGEVKQYRFTVPEGLRRDEILPILAASSLGLKLERLETLSKDPSFLSEHGITGGSAEGFLFPDTYTFTRSVDEEAVLAKMFARAHEELARALTQQTKDPRLNPAQALVLASIVEKETGAPQERPRISCVFHNRLRLGMKLQTDPTVLYASMLVRGHFVKNITRKDLETPHPYNTYTTPGLPPGPIANPGAAAMLAAVAPIDCDDLYFVSRNDGTHVFCPTLECHNAAVTEWQQRYFRQKKKASSDVSARKAP